MGVYIIGEKMPNNCTECFKHNKCDKYHIEIVKNEDGDFLPTYIADNCPLIEVTEPHGRLIDADKQHKRLQKQVMALYSEKSDKYSYLMDVLYSIHGEPTVIEAEDE